MAVEISDPEELSLFFKSTSLDKKKLIRTENVWSKEVKVEESSYYWNGEPLILQKKQSSRRKPGAFLLLPVQDDFSTLTSIHDFKTFFVLFKAHFVSYNLIDI